MINKQKIVVIDYGMGNLWSVISALDYMNAKCSVSSDPVDIVKADALILPGVGSFRRAMSLLTEHQIDIAIKEAVCVKQRKILGICLGFQMLAKFSTEDGFSVGLELIETGVESFNYQILQEKKLPHIGFNKVSFSNASGLFDGFKNPQDFYFIHSYRLMPYGLPGNKAICKYGEDFLAAYQCSNIMGTQFHPEKSQTNGLKLLANFLSV